MRIIRAKCRVLSQLVPQPLEGCGNHKDCWVSGRELGSICKIGLRSFMNWRKTRLLFGSELESANRANAYRHSTNCGADGALVSVPELCVARTMSSMGMTDRRSTMNHPLPAHNLHLEDARVLTRTRTRQNEAHSS